LDRVQVLDPLALVDDDDAVLDLEALVGRLGLAGEVLLAALADRPAGEVLAVEQALEAVLDLEVVGGAAGVGEAEGGQGGQAGRDRLPGAKCHPVILPPGFVTVSESLSGVGLAEVGSTGVGRRELPDAGPAAAESHYLL